MLFGTCKPFGIPGTGRPKPETICCCCCWLPAAAAIAAVAPPVVKSAPGRRDWVRVCIHGVCGESTESSSECDLYTPGGQLFGPACGFPIPPGLPPGGPSGVNARGGACCGMPTGADCGPGE